MNHKYINTRVFQLLSPKDYQPWEWRGEGRDLLGALKSISRVGSLTWLGLKSKEWERIGWELFSSWVFLRVWAKEKNERVRGKGRERHWLNWPANQCLTACCLVQWHQHQQLEAERLLPFLWRVGPMVSTFDIQCQTTVQQQHKYESKRWSLVWPISRRQLPATGTTEKQTPLSQLLLSQLLDDSACSSIACSACWALCKKFKGHGPHGCMYAWQIEKGWKAAAPPFSRSQSQNCMHASGSRSFTSLSHDEAWEAGNASNKLLQSPTHMHSIFGQELTRCTTPQILVRHSKISSRTSSIEREQWTLAQKFDPVNRKFPYSIFNTAKISWKKIRHLELAFHK